MSDKLYAAAGRGDLAGVKMWATKENLNDHHGEYSLTPLHITSQKGHLEVVKWLVGTGAQIEAQAKDSFTPLYITSQNGHLEVAKWLVGEGAQIEAKTINGYTPLYVTSQQGHLEVVKWLVGAGAQIEAKTKKGFTPLHSASQNGHLEVVKWLVGEGAQIEAKTKGGYTPLMLAAYHDRVELVQQLVELGANTAATNSSGQTALDLAKKENNNKVVEVLTAKKLLFLDCEQIQTDVYTLTWGLPNVVGGGALLIEVKDRTNQWQRVQGPINKGKTFSYLGAAIEFRMAYQNKFGLGQFTTCEPAPNLSDEKLLPSDRKTILDNIETFSQMTSIEEIVMRLTSRHVLHQLAGERVINCLNQRGPLQGARWLIEEVRRCNYKELFYFRKTLEEFGQTNLAALVPVREIDDKLFDEESFLGGPLSPAAQRRRLEEKRIQNRDDGTVVVYSGGDQQPHQTPDNAAIPTDGTTSTTVTQTHQ